MSIRCAVANDCDRNARNVNGLNEPYAAASLPRLLVAGPAQLDLFHRDVLIGERWAGLHPREFEVLWAIVVAGGRTLSRGHLLTHIWRIGHDPGTNRVAVHVARVRAKLRPFGLQWLIATDPAGGYRLGHQHLAVR